MIWFIIAIILVICLFLYFKFFKIPKLKNVVFIDGTLGSGKTLLSVALHDKLYKRNLRKVKINNFFRKIFRKPLRELPYKYSNIPLYKTEYVEFNKNLLTRENERFAFKSVGLLDEYSLVADQNIFGQYYKTKYVNENGVQVDLLEQMAEFWKLFRHETKGGSLIVNSQSISDLNFTLKSVISDYFYIHSRIKLPFITIFKIQECRFSRDNAVLQVNDGDIEDKLKLLIISNKYYKYYDTYCHSIYTDMLPPKINTKYIIDRKDLKSSYIVSFKDLKYLYQNFERREEENDKKEIE